jgi:hypothetical protein
MLFDPIILFFIAGVLIKSMFRSLHVPSIINSVISSLILITIGLKGGIELCTWACGYLLVQMFFVLLLSAVTYYVAKILLVYLFGYAQEDALVIAAHYGSVSVTTFAVGLAVLQSKEVAFEPYMPLFVALMELPSVIIASLEQHRLHPQAGTFWDTLRQTFMCKSILLLLGSILCGYFFSSTVMMIFKPLLFDNFRILLAILLSEMGILVGDEFSLIKKNAALIVSTAITLSLAGAFCGIIFGLCMGLSEGGVVLLTLLAASASYIAVPAVLRRHNPPARISLALGHALGVTFPFNIFIGIYVYISVVRLMYGYIPFVGGWFLF